MTQTPRWHQIDRDYPQARKRLGFGGRMGLMLTGLLPTYQMERNWPGDQLRMYGASARTTLPSSTGRLNAISLHNVSLLLPREDWQELLVWKVTARSFTGGVILPNWIESSMQDFHVFTPLVGYNPHNFPDTFPVVFAFLQPLEPERIAAFPSHGHLDVGSNINLMTVIINGVPTAGIGPRLAQTPSIWILGGPTPGSQGFGAAQDMDYIPSGDAPPFRVMPGERLTVQQLIFPATTLQGIEASFWWSERPFAQGT